MNKKIVIIGLMLVMFILPITVQAQVVPIPIFINRGNSYEGNLEGTFVQYQEKNETLYIGIKESRFSDEITWIKIDEYRIDPRPFLYQGVSISVQGTTLTDIYICEELFTHKEFSTINSGILLIVLVAVIIFVLLMMRHFPH